MITLSQVEELLEKAKSANQDEWRVDPGYVNGVNHILDGNSYDLFEDPSLATCEHIAAANPQTVTLLCQKLVEMSVALEEIADEGTWPEPSSWSFCPKRARDALKGWNDGSK